MKLLAIDTCTEACSVAILQDDIIHEDFLLPEQKNSKHILQMIEQQLARAGLILSQLDTIAFSHGPGSFTGIRIATNVVQGLAVAADLPVIGISSLRSLAQLCYRLFSAEDVISAIDARMGEIYLGAYSLDDNAIMQGVSQDKLTSPKKLPPLTEAVKFHGAGSAWDCYTELLHAHYSISNTHIHHQQHPHAYDIASLAADEFRRGQAIAVDDLTPHYLRNDVAKKGKKHG